MNERDIFMAAVRIENRESRDEYLSESCGDDSRLRERVEALLDARDRDNSLLDDSLGRFEPTRDMGVSTPESGRQIGVYRLREKIGEGGFGVVYVAEQTKPVRRKVALKIIKPGMDSKEVVARFEAERQALALMDHLHIAKVLDAGTTDSGHPYFVMELVHGVPITDYCDDNRLTTRQRLDLFVPVCQAIHHAHQKGIIHRDIKPSNILVTMYDDKPVPKVIDFGIAKAIEQRLTEKTIYTRFGTMVGTYEYVSPEQAEMNAFGVDTRSDVYSLGVLLYELITGATPLDRAQFQEATYGDIIRLIKEEEPLRPSVRISKLKTVAKIATARQTEPTKLTSQVRGELDWIIMRCLEKDRSRRYDGAGALANDLQNYLSGDAVAACPPTWGYRLRKAYRKHRKSVLTAALIAASLIAATGISIASGIKSKQAERAAREQQQVATANEQRAVQNEQTAKRRLDEVTTARERLARVEYASSIRLAQREWQDTNTTTARRLLDNTREDLRGWEWQYLDQLKRAHAVMTMKTHATERTSNGRYAISGADFNHDGTRIVTFCSNEGMVRVWESATGKRIREIVVQSGFLVDSALFSPDGKHILTVANNEQDDVGIVTHWDAYSGAEYRSTPYAEKVRFAHFSAEGNRLLTGADTEEIQTGSRRTVAVTIRDTANGKELLTIPSRSGAEAIRGAAISPDAEQIATHHRDGMTLWDANAGDSQRTRTFVDGISADFIVYSPDGKQIATANYGEVTIWNVETLALEAVLKGEFAAVFDVAYRPDGQQIATVDRSGGVRLWDARGGNLQQSLIGHSDRVFSAKFSPDGHHLVTSSADGTTRVWDVTDTSNTRKFRAGSSWISALAVSPDGALVSAVSATDNVVRIFDTRRGQELATLERSGTDSETIFVASVAFSPDSKSVVGATRQYPSKDLRNNQQNENSGGFIVWNAQSGAELHAVDGLAAPVNHATFDNTGSRIVTACNDKTARVWNAATGEQLVVLEKHSDAVTSASFSPDGHWIVTTSADNTGIVWDANTGRFVRTLEGHKGPVNVAAFTPDGSKIATASSDHTLIIWDSLTGERLHSLEGHGGGSWSLSMHPNGSRLASTGQDGTARVWDVANGLELLSFEIGDRVPGHKAIFSPDDGQRLYVTQGPFVQIIGGDGLEPVE